VTPFLDLTSEKKIVKLQITFVVSTPLGSNIIILQSISESISYIVLFSFMISNMSSSNLWGNVSKSIDTTYQKFCFSSGLKPIWDKFLGAQKRPCAFNG